VIYKISGKKIVLPLLITISNVLSLVAGILATARAIALNSTEDLNDVKFRVALALFPAMGLLSDALTTGTMCSYIGVVWPRQRSSSNSAALNQLLIFLMSRGVVLCVAEAVYLIVITATPGTFYWIPVHLCLSRLYVNTSLVLFNQQQNNHVRRDTVNTVSPFTRPVALGRQDVKEAAMSPAASSPSELNDWASATRKNSGKLDPSATGEFKIVEMDIFRRTSSDVDADGSIVA